MKLKHLLPLLLLAVGFASCTPDNGDDGPQSKPQLTLSTSPLLTIATSGTDIYFPEWTSDATVSINGIPTQVGTIKAGEPQTANFDIPEGTTAPYSVIFPHVEGSTVEKPIVVIPSQQSLRPEVFDFASMPMCAVVSSGTTATMRHMTSAVVFDLKSTTQGTTTISKIVFTSLDDSKLSGTFEVNCNFASLKATADNTNTITYFLPNNFTISTERPQTIRLLIPYGKHGNCQIEVFDIEGKSLKMKWDNVDAQGGFVYKFNTVEYIPDCSVTLGKPNSNENNSDPIFEKVYGYVKDTAGNPVAGVAVSDGFTVVSTDSNGYYSLKVSTDTWYIYYSTPAEYQVEVNQYGQPCFWKEFPTPSPRVDFTLTPIAGGKEKKFALFAFADPQVYSSGNLNRFLNEAVPGIAAHARSLDIPKYGITLGDIIFNTDNQKCTHMMDDMRDGFSVSKTGMPVFQIMGNHDQNEYDASHPLVVDSRSSDINIKAQRDFETMFGPVNYSFNRADAHIIGMRNVIFSSATSSGTSSYHLGFTNKQFEWLKQDLALVPKDKLILFCVHIPLFDEKSKNIASLNTSTNVQEVLNLLKTYPNVHILSGHKHTQQNYVNAQGIKEHNIASVAGAWWISCVCGDGTPNGFNVFVTEGNKLSEEYFYGYTAATSSREKQMRLYRGNAVTGGPISGTNPNKTMGYYGFNFADDVILANVYNAASDWKISVYEDGVYSGDMTLLPATQPAIGALIGDYTYDNPRRAADGVVTGHDFWVAGYMLGVLGRTTSNGGWAECQHMYQYKLKNKNATIKVVATDSLGHTYEESTITEGTDYSAAVKPS